MNKELKDILQDIVDLSYKQKINTALEAINDLAEEMNKKYDPETFTDYLAAVFSTAVCADAKLAPEEYIFVTAFFKAVDIFIDTDAVIAKMIKAAEDNSAYAAVNRLLEDLSSEGKVRLFTVIAAICAMDDNIDENEISFLSDVYHAI